MWLPVTTRGVEIPRWLATGVASTALLAMVFTTNELILDPPAAAAVEEPDPATLYDSNGDGIPDRPDRVSAALLARQIDLPVEDMSARTESATTVVEPDGALTLEDFGGPVRIQRDAMNPETGEAEPSWVDVDYTLTEIDGGRYAPAASPATVIVGGAWNGQPEAARVEFDDGAALAITWPGGDLGEPSVEGGVATYEISESMDLVVAMTTAGASAWVRINDELTPAETTAIETGGVTFGLRTTGGANLITTEDALAADPTLAPDVHTDGLVLTDPSGEAVGATSELVAWDDSTTDATGMPDETVPLEVQLEATGTSGTGAEKVTAHELTVTPPEGFLTGDDIEYPVVIDPQVDRLTQVQDTWVRPDINGGNGSDMKLLVGPTTAGGNANKAQSYLHFNTAPLVGKDIARAHLGLYQYYAGSCAAKTMNVHGVNGTWTEGNMAWNTQPAVHSTQFTAHSANRGGTNCTGTNAGPGYTEVNVTPIAQNWADGYWTNRGVRLATPANADATFERRFCSMNTSTAFNVCNTAAYKPYLRVTYNAAPSYTSIPKLALGVGMTWNNVLNVSTGRPTFVSASVDEDGTWIQNRYEVRLNNAAGNVVSTCLTDWISSGQAESCQIGAALTNGQIYVIRARGEDENGGIGPWSGWRTFRVNNVAPVMNTNHNCGPYANGTWYETLPNTSGSTTCAVNTTGAVEVRWEVNGESAGSTRPTAGGTSSINVPVPATGWTNVVAQGFSSAGVPTSRVTYGFGTGAAGLNEPVADTTSSTTFPVQASAPQGATSAAVQWRVAPTTEGDTTTGWTNATKVDVAETGSPWTGTVTAPSGTSISQTPRVLWDARGEDDIDLGALVQVRVRFTYPGGGTKDSPFERVNVIKSAFGENFPTQAVGPAAVALATGEMSVGGADIEVPGYGEPISIGRKHLTLAGETTGPQSVFGPGWIGDFSGPSYGAAGFTLVDRTNLDGTLQLNDNSGSTYVYAHESGTRAAQQTGLYLGVGETAFVGDRVRLDPVTGEPGVSHRLVIVDTENTTSTFKRISTGATGYTWVTESVRGPESNSTTTYAYNADGTTAWIIAPAPSGVSCSPTSLVRGCRALEMIYTGNGTGATGTKRLTEVRLRIWDPKPGTDGRPNPVTAEMVSVPVAKYAYNNDNILTAAWDPRLGDGTSARKVEFTYTDITVGSSPKKMVATINEPGVVPWEFSYDTQGRLTTVERAHDPLVSTSSKATWRVKYNVPLSGDGLPDLTSTATPAWGQPADAAPIYATAVFEPDYTGNASPAAGDWSYATISYFDKKGRTTNEAVYGAGQWLIESQRYDAKSNIVWDLDAEGRDRALEDGGANAELSATAADLYASHTVYNSAGTRVEATYSPSREVVLEDGSIFMGRTLTETVYDDEAPASLMPGRPTTGIPEGDYDLEIEQTSAVVGSYPADASTTRHDLSRSRNQYHPLTATDGDGWTLKAPTRVLVEDPSITTGPTPGWAVSLTRYDQQGNITESRTPAVTAMANGLAATSSDPRTTQTIYYTAGASSITACGDKPEWAGLVCVVRPAGTPAVGAPVPTDSTTGYSMLTVPVREEESSGSATRVVVTQLDAQSRPTVETTTVGTENLTTATSYHELTGAVTSVSNGTSTQTTTYDSWGRVVTQTDGVGNTATSSYGTDGRLASLSDGKGTYSYTYDGTDALGKTERRGLVTSLDTGFTSGDGDTITAAYNHDGKLLVENYPGGYTATTSYDMDGNATDLSYTRTTSGGTSPVIAYTQTYDADGRVRSGTSPTGTVNYTYDSRDRLAHVRDTDAAGQCTSRTYTFTPDSNRSTLNSYGPGNAGACQTDLNPATTAYTYDAADRLTGGSITGYVYDNLGRTTTVPKGHTDRSTSATAGDLTLAYHPDDMVKTLSQTVPDPAGGAGTITRAQTFTLDASGRVSTTSTSSNATTLQETTHHYSDTEDSPAWTHTRQRPNGAAPWTDSWERFIAAASGSFSMTQDQAGEISLNIVNLHDDITATIDLGTNATGPGILESYTEYTEYGAAKNSPGVEGRYGWLGQNQRENQGITGGLTTMGARLYNPATGRFLSMDPVRGGNDNTYVYPTDPVNMTDLDGEWGVPKFVKKAAKKAKRRLKKAAKFVKKHRVDIALTAAGFVPGIGQAAWAVRGYRAYKGYKAARSARSAGRAASRAARRARSGRRCRNSFVPGTLVLLADGSTKPIEDVDVGDLVLATDPATGETAAEEVTDLILGEGLKALVRLGTDADADGETEWVTATSNHPFWVKARGWTNAGDLEVGDLLISDDGQLIEVTRLSETVRMAAVHNLTVDRIHTYYVVPSSPDGTASDHPVLVHNCFSDHARERMEERGISEDMVYQAIRTGRKSRGNKPNTWHYRGRRVWAVTDQRGCVISCGWNGKR
ncbi:DNRLRE domain-containing protein [Nocardioides alkalitolerans]|uniref:DNRLRE domain-containing protein n=1 Tax=Nocardioides alkalitolerans TaxID=281714 RepID=UPI001FE074C0|nr:DNRLRE domain-containing protein [Nocardioides alkalitolerans]